MANTDEQTDAKEKVVSSVETEQKTNANEEFDWNEYLKECGAIAAPANCFFQRPEPPPNKFQKNQKLEANDQRCPSSKIIMFRQRERRQSSIPLPEHRA